MKTLLPFTKMLLVLLLLPLWGFAQCRLQLDNYDLVFNEGFDKITHPSQLEDRWQFVADDANVSFGGGEYYVNPTVNNYANLELRSEVINNQLTKYLRLKAVKIMPGDFDYNKAPVVKRPTNCQSTNPADVATYDSLCGYAKFRSALLMTKKGVSAAPTFPFDPSGNSTDVSGASRGFLYGVFQIRMRIDKANSFPAFWLYGQAPNQIGITQPDADGAPQWKTGIQLNPFEGKGTPNFRGSTRNFGVGYSDDGYGNNTFPGQAIWVTKQGWDDLADNFHTYTAVWTPNKISFFFDDREVATFTGTPQAVLTQIRRIPAQLIVSLQMFRWLDQGPGDHSAHLDIDYIRVYKPKNNTPWVAYPEYKSSEEWMYSNLFKKPATASPAQPSEAVYGALTLKDGASPQVFYRGTDNYLYQATEQNGVRSVQQVPYNYATVANYVLIKGDIAYNRTYNAVFFVGQDNRIQFFANYNTNSWYHAFADDDWGTAAYLASADPGSVAVSDNGKVVYRGLDNRIHVFEYASASNDWIPSASINAAMVYPAGSDVQGDVAVSANGNNIYYRGSDGTIYSLYLNGGSYVQSHVVDETGAWNVPNVKNVPGAIVATDTNNGADIYYIGDTDSRLHVLHYNYTTNPGRWEYRATYTAGTNANELINTSLAWHPGLHRMFYIGYDGRIQFVEQTGGAWNHAHVDTYWAHNNFASFSNSQSQRSSLALSSAGNAVFYNASGNTDAAYFSVIDRLSSMAWAPCQVTNPEQNGEYVGDDSHFDTWPVLNRGMSGTPAGPPVAPTSALEQALSVAVYPNPVTRALTVQLSKPSAAVYTGVIYDVQGRPVMKIGILKFKTELDVSALPAGLYLLVLTDGVAHYKTKFTKI